MTARKLSHVDGKGRAHMVDVSEKSVTARTAVATAQLVMKPSVLRRIVSGDVPKGDVLAAARIAGIQAAKRTHELIPLCHPIAVTSVRVDFTSDEPSGVLSIRSEVRTRDRTGVEMEALTAASVAALTVYDMCKAVQRDIEIRHISLLEKRGGRSGTYKRKGS